jgi:aspartyl/asparaginyl-tRNA synthetase
MDVKQLKLSSVLLIVVGFLVLGIYTFTYQPTNIFLTQDNFEYIGHVVSVSGNIKFISDSENNLFFKICDLSKCLPAVYFNSSEFNKNKLYTLYQNNAFLVFTGKLTEYDTKLELIVYKFEVMNAN